MAQMNVKCLTTTMSDYWNSEWVHYVPAPGEAIIIQIMDIQQTNLKMGDGKRTLAELPYIFNADELEGVRPMNKTCAQCEHLCIINRNKIYAVCDETGKSFELWRMDTREADACERFIPKEDQDTKITLLKCPHCKKPMRWTAGNSVFSYWECYNCNKSFEYNVWTETFHDEKDFI